MAQADPAASVAGGPLDSRAWERIVGRIMDGKPALGAVLQHGAPLEVSAAKIVLAFPRGSFFGRRAEALDGRRALAEVAEAVLGGRPAVEVVDGTVGDSEGAKTLVELDKERRDARIAATKERALSHPLVVEAAQVFRLAPDSMKVRVELE